MNTRPAHTQKGFTLVEIAIVIVVIGLLVAGVTAGRSVIEGARLNSIIQDTTKYITAYTAFKTQYGAAPGDMANASSYWPAAVNGNGDGLVGETNISSAEALGIWQHLALAGLIEGSYTGLYGAGVVLGSNAPPTDYNNNSTFYTYSHNLWNMYDRGNSIVLSGLLSVGWDNPQIAVVDAYKIDKKIDDAMPYIGNVVSYSNVDDTCVAAGLRLSDTPPDKKVVTYKLIPATNLCVMHFAFSDYTFK